MMSHSDQPDHTQHNAVTDRQVTALNNEFGAPGSLLFRRDQSNGLITAEMFHPNGQHLQLYLWGAHITAWTAAEGDDLLFLSSKAILEEGKAIRGGIPIVFPQFGPGEMPSHGFARVSMWQVAGASAAPDRVELILKLQDNSATQAIWPDRQFEMELAVCLDTSLTTRLRVTNTSAESFSFTNAFHTYFKVGDIHQTFVRGLQGSQYSDRLHDSSQLLLEADAQIAFSEETDRDYINVPSQIEIADLARGLLFSINTSGMADAVVWNPWIDKSIRLEDFADNEYLQMACVEPGNLKRRIELAAGASWEGIQRLSYAKLKA